MIDLSALPAPVQARITRLLADAELAFAAAPEWVNVENQPGDTFVIIGPVLPAAREPARFVLTVFEAIGSLLCETAQQLSWPGETLRRQADQILRHVIADTYESKHRYPASESLATFASRVRQELARRPVWLTLQQTIRDRSVEPTLGEQLTALRDECGWTTAELERRLQSMTRTAIEDNLFDRTTPHPDNLAQYRKVFSEALKRPIVLTTPRKKTKHR